MIFRSKVDIWLVAVLLLASAAPLLVAAFAISDGDPWLPHVVASLLIAGASIWLLRSTRYTVSGTEVLIQSGPFKWRLAAASIMCIVPSRSIVSSPALSVERLKLEYDNGRKSLLVSPKDRDGFIKAIEAAKGDA